jgi:hypothetical protein
MAADRLKHVVVEDFPALLATLHQLKSEGAGVQGEKHVLVVMHNLTPLLMTQKVSKPVYTVQCSQIMQ